MSNKTDPNKATETALEAFRDEMHSFSVPMAATTAGAATAFAMAGQPGAAVVMGAGTALFGAIRHVSRKK